MTGAGGRGARPPANNDEKFIWLPWAGQGWAGMAGGMGAFFNRSARHHLAWVGGIALGVLAALCVVAGLAGFFDRDPVRLLPAKGARRPVAALYLSGDMGLRFGPNAYTTQALAAEGIDVVALKSPTLFRLRRTHAQVDAIVADGIRDALVRTGGERLILIGQSYGADILETALADLPAGLRRRVAGVVLVVPGESVYFRADPSGLAYRGMPDSIGAATLDRIDWLPVTCIYGRDEVDSACPEVHLPNARIVAMRGGHFLNNDRPALFAEILAAIRRAVPHAFAA